jgi:hypothetical protein
VIYKVKVAAGSPEVARFGPLVLADQFQSVKQNVIKPKYLGVPADKNDEGLLDPNTHLVEYQVKNKSGEPKFAGEPAVGVTNQCGSIFPIEVSKVRTLMVPSHKDLGGPATPPDPNSHAVDHFRCYKAKAASTLPKGIQVVVDDQFHAQPTRYDLKKLTRVCAPVAKSEDPLDPVLILSGGSSGQPKPIEPATIENPTAHLACYKAKLASRLIPQQGCGPVTPGDTGTPIDQTKPPAVLGANVNNQFGPLILDTVKVAEICIPSLKSLGQ